MNIIYSQVYKEIRERVHKYYKNLNIHDDHSHGFNHTLRVTSMVMQAIEKNHKIININTKKAIIFAALLHDIDDRKITKSSIKTNNAETILNDILYLYMDPKDIREIKYMTLRAIDLVSFSKNGNTIPEDLTTHSPLLYPRYADRYEAVGLIGIARCAMYAKEETLPFSHPSTIIAKSHEHALKLASAERLNNYLKTGHSKSVQDHIYDKLLHIVTHIDDLPDYFKNYFDRAQDELITVAMIEDKDKLYTYLNNCIIKLQNNEYL